MQAADGSGLKSTTLLVQEGLKGYSGNQGTWDGVTSRNNFCHGASRELSKFDSCLCAMTKRIYTFRHE
jgi:hypothetical protein